MALLKPFLLLWSVKKNNKKTCNFQGCWFVLCAVHLIFRQLYFFRMAAVTNRVSVVLWVKTETRPPLLQASSYSWRLRAHTGKINEKKTSFLHSTLYKIYTSRRTDNSFPRPFFFFILPRGFMAQFRQTRSLPNITVLKGFHGFWDDSTSVSRFVTSLHSVRLISLYPFILFLLFCIGAN